MTAVKDKSISIKAKIGLERMKSSRSISSKNLLLPPLTIKDTSAAAKIPRMKVGKNTVM